MLNIAQPKNGKVLEVLIEPDARLHQKADEVGVVSDDIRLMISDMKATMQHYKGVGLAAVQVGIMQRILVADFAYFATMDEQSKLCQPAGCDIIVMINPKITEFSDELADFQEGCLSLPEVFLTVKRPVAIKAQYLDYLGHQQEIALRGKIADCVQHEIDHLDGILITDRVSALKRDLALKRLDKIKKRSKI